MSISSRTTYWIPICTFMLAASSRAIEQKEMTPGCLYQAEVVEILSGKKPLAKVRLTREFGGGAASSDCQKVQAKGILKGRTLSVAVVSVKKKPKKIDPKSIVNVRMFEDFTGRID